MWKRPKIKSEHTHHETVKMEPASKHVQELQQKSRKTISKSALSLSLSLFLSLSLSLSSRRFISLCQAKIVDSFFTPCFPLLDAY